VSDVLPTALAALVGYLLGSIPTADIVTRLATRGRVDIRAAGSGNPGGLNAMQVVGKGWGVAVIVVDVAKGAAAGFAGYAIGDTAGAYAAATASIAGHIFPVWSRFRGGKGVATSGGACLAVFPPFFPIDAAVAAMGALGTRHPERTIWVNGVVWIGLAVLWWALDLPNLWGPPPTWGLVAFTVVSSIMIAGKFRAAAIAASRAAPA
jgi:acyl phosphate:glycerol-3-phosphate acyltransferase